MSLLQQLSQQNSIIKTAPFLINLTTAGVQQLLFSHAVFQLPQNRFYGSQPKLPVSRNWQPVKQNKKIGGFQAGSGQIQIQIRNASISPGLIQNFQSSENQVLKLERPEKVSSQHVDEFVNGYFNPCYSCTPFELSGPTDRTIQLNNISNYLQIQEMKSGKINVDQNVVASNMNIFSAGYINQELEQIVGLQTDQPLKCAAKSDYDIQQIASQGTLEQPPRYLSNKKSVDCGIYDAFSDDMIQAKKCGLITGGLQEGGSRVGGDYRRVALYGVDHIINSKKLELQDIDCHPMSIEKIQNREDIKQQIKALNQLKSMAMQYGYDIGPPAEDAHQAIQWLYFAFLGSIKEHDGASMCLGKIDSFLDAYIQHDLNSGKLTEQSAQELIDHFVMKLRMVRQLPTQKNSINSPNENNFAKILIGGWNGNLNRPEISKTSFRFINALNNLGPTQSTNISVIWDRRLPENFQQICCEASINTNGLEYISKNSPQIQIQNSNLQIQSCQINLYKFLMLIFNQGRDNITQNQIAPNWAEINLQDKKSITIDDILQRMDMGIQWLSKLCIGMSNIQNYMQDQYDYERLEFSLQNTNPNFDINFQINGLQEFVNILSALKFGKIKPVTNFSGQIIDIETSGDFPKYGSNDQHVKYLENWVIDTCNYYFKKIPQYKHGVPILTKRLRQQFIDPRSLQKQNTHAYKEYNMHAYNTQKNYMHACSKSDVCEQQVSINSQNTQQQLMQSCVDNLVNQLDLEFEKDIGQVKVEYVCNSCD